MGSAIAVGRSEARARSTSCVPLAPCVLLEAMHGHHSSTALPSPYHPITRAPFRPKDLLVSVLHLVCTSKDLVFVLPTYHNALLVVLQTRVELTGASANGAGAPDSQKLNVSSDP